MRMPSGPRNLSGQIVGRARDPADLQPSEDDVKLRRATDEAERAANLLNTPKASEEKKQIAWTHVVTREMTLRGARLAEDRTPPGAARNRIAAQIRIEMRAVATADLAVSQVLDNLRDR